MEMDLSMVGKRIKEIRISQGLSQVSLASALKCDPCYVSKLEGGSKNTSITRLVAVADALNVSVDELLGRGTQVDDEVNTLFADCTLKERRLMIGALRGLKAAMRENK